MMAEEDNENKGIVISTPEGDKTFGADDVKNLFDQNSDLTKKTEDLANVSKAIERYGTDPDTYLSNAEAAFGVMTELIGKGVIDDKGNVIKGKTAGDGSGSGDNSGGDFSQGSNQDDIFKGDKVSKIVAKVVETKLGGLVKQVEELTSGQAGLFRTQLKTTIQGKFPSFSNEDVSRLFGIASANPGKDLWTHAEEMAEKKKTGEQSSREKYAKEFGVNLESFDENQLREQNADGGSVALFPGKDFKFSKRARRLGAKDSVSPKEAMIAHMKAQKQA